MEWQADMATMPRDAMVLVAVEPTESNRTFSTYPATVYPAYIDDDGNICDCDTWKPDPGLFGQFWRSTHWMPFPAPPTSRPTTNEGERG